MTDSMIERVARAIEAAIREADKNQLSTGYIAEKHARDVIKAMREPTDYMKAAWKFEVHDPAWSLHDWQTAIDAALNEKART